ncbi:MAG TPA: helix-turn-helix transcriptional regulator, partial [Ktedonobacterales bacterium]|nr:helix-turn-helix transcriptional regulator [Ktedonobacterales bacterium]
MARTQPAKSVRLRASARTMATVEADASSVPSAAGTLLARYRKERGLTQGELGRLSQVATDTISALERGKRHVPQRETLDRLIKALDLAPEEAALFHAAANATRRSSRPAPAPAPRPPARTSDPVSREAQVEHELAFVHRPPAEAAESGQLASAAAAEPVNVRQADSDERQRWHGGHGGRRGRRGRRGRWRLPLPGVTAALAPVSLLLVALIIANLLIGRSQFASAASLPLSGAQVRGWLVYQQWATRKPSIMAVMDAATGEWRALWPDARFLSQGATSDTTETFSSLRAP